MNRLESFSDIFGNSDYEIVEIDIDDLVPFEDHPFKLYEGKRFDDMVESIRDFGILSPIIVRRIGGKYQILAGHNRVNAATSLKISYVPAIVKEGIDDEEAKLIVTETNLIQRSFNEMSYSEKAKSLEMHYKAMKCQGKRTDLVKEIEKLVTESAKVVTTSSQVGTRLTSMDTLGKNYDLSKNTVARYIRLNNLITPLLDMVDKGELAFLTGVELSFINKENQQKVLEKMKKVDKRVSLKNAIILKKKANVGELATNDIEEVVSNNNRTKNELSKKVTMRINLPEHIVTKYFGDDVSKKNVLDIIEVALNTYYQYDAHEKEY